MRCAGGGTYVFRRTGPWVTEGFGSREEGSVTSAEALFTCETTRIFVCHVMHLLTFPVSWKMWDMPGFCSPGKGTEAVAHCLL